MMAAWWQTRHRRAGWTPLARPVAAKLRVARREGADEQEALTGAAENALRAASFSSFILRMGILLRGWALTLQDARRLDLGARRLDPLQGKRELPVVAEIVDERHRLSRLERQFTDADLVG